MAYNIFFNILIPSIAKIYFESRSKNKLEKLLLFYSFFGMKSQKFHLIASDAIWTYIIVDVKIIWRIWIGMYPVLC